jgi:HEAT repeat protein
MIGASFTEDGHMVTRVQKLIRRLKHDDPLKRIHAGLLLGDMGAAATEAVPTLLEMLNGSSVQDRKLAAVALGYIGRGAVEAVPALRHAMRDTDEVVRRLAAAALEKIHAPEGRDRAA